MSGRRRLSSMWGTAPTTMPTPEHETGRRLAAFTPAEMREEIAIVHGIYLPAPFVAYEDGITAYSDRGGGCLFVETIENACAALGINRSGLTAPSLEDDTAYTAEREFVDHLMSIRRTLWLTYGIQERRLELCAVPTPAHYMPFVRDVVSALTRIAVSLTTMGSTALARRTHEALQFKVDKMLAWLLGSGILIGIDATDVQALADQWAKIPKAAT